MLKNQRDFVNARVARWWVRGNALLARETWMACSRVKIFFTVISKLQGDALLNKVTWNGSCQVEYHDDACFLPQADSYKFLKATINHKTLLAMDCTNMKTDSCDPKSEWHVQLRLTSNDRPGLATQTIVAGKEPKMKRFTFEQEKKRTI